MVMPEDSRIYSLARGHWPDSIYGVAVAGVVSVNVGVGDGVGEEDVSLVGVGAGARASRSA